MVNREDSGEYMSHKVWKFMEERLSGIVKKAFTMIERRRDETVAMDGGSTGTRERQIKAALHRWRHAERGVVVVWEWNERERFFRTRNETFFHCSI